MSSVIMALLMLALAVSAGAQSRYEQRTDSLKRVVSAMPDDTVKAELLDNIAMRLISRNRKDEAEQYARLMLDLSVRIGWKDGELKAYNELGNIYEASSEFPAALDAYFKAMRLAEELNTKDGVGLLSGNISNIYLTEENYPEALKYSRRFLHIYEEIGDPTGIMIALGSVANVFAEQGDHAHAITFYLKALTIADTLADTNSIATNSANIGNAYCQLKQYSRALAYDYRALALAERISSVDLKGAAMANIGEALLRLAQAPGPMERDSLIPTGKLLALTKAISYIEQSLKITQSLGRYPEIMTSARNLSQAYALRGDYKAALAAFQTSAAARDSIFNTRNTTRIHGLETKRALDLKEKDIQIANLALDKKKNERGFFMAGIGLLLGMLGLLFGNYKKQQRATRLLSKEKSRSDSLLLNILPPEIAQELKENGIANARQFNEVTVLFTDFVNFTGTAEYLTPQGLVKELHECFSAFDNIIERNGLEKIKTVGDAYIAVCGLPVADDRHAQKCVQAAIEIIEFMEQRKREGRVFEIRIGLNSGPVVAGIVGVKKFAYDIWGDTVNTAARMEQHGQTGRINISETTYQLVKDDFRCIRRGRIAAKNKGEIEMYFVARDGDTLHTAAEHLLADSAIK